MTATTERTRDDAVADLMIANAAAKCLRDRRHGVPEADKRHDRLNELLDEVVGR
jgi:hypothetical protein